MWQKNGKQELREEAKETGAEAAAILEALRSRKDEFRSTKQMSRDLILFPVLPWSVRVWEDSRGEYARFIGILILDADDHGTFPSHPRPY